MFNNFIKQILEAKNITSIYAHNLSGFDGIFLLKHLINYESGKVEPLIFSGKIISIKFIYTEGIGKDKKTRTITFKDSYLLLPSSLRELAKTFSTSINVFKSNILAKGHFPFKLNDINYIGDFPSKNLFPSDLSVNDYLELKSVHHSSMVKNGTLELNHKDIVL